MLRGRWFQVLVVAVVAICLLVLPGGVLAQEQWDRDLDRVRSVQERHTPRLMAQNGVVGTAVGLDARGGHTLLILVEKPGVPGVPASLEGVSVQPVITGKIYALAILPTARGPAGPAKQTTLPPAAPSDLKATAVGSSQINLIWTDKSSNETGFGIERKAGTGSFRLVATVGANKTSFSDTRLAGATTYTYRMYAYNNGGNSTYSNSASATTKSAYWYARPVPIGVSTGNSNEDAAGTISCRLQDDKGHYYVLSNNHVYAREDAAQIGEIVVQPGRYDSGGRYDPTNANEIGTLYKFVAISFTAGTTNTVDAAIAILPDDKGEPCVGFATPLGGYGAPNSFTRLLTQSDIGLSVQKYGRSSLLTKGTVTGTNATIDITYATGTARFVNQIVVQSRQAFIKAGDSGSLLVTNDSAKKPVGLLFAGNDSGTYAIANHIDDVLNAFAGQGLTVGIDDGR